MLLLAGIDCDVMDSIDITLPLTNPVLKFLLILIIILFAPIILNKIKIPHLLGLIIAGAVIGPNGINLLSRDSSIILSGTAGLLYIMFLAGLEIDMADFKKNSKISLFFGLCTFLIPMILGTFTGIYILEFSVPTSVLLASMFASHTLITYPLVSNLGLAKNKAVNITLGGTMITDTLALLVLAVIAGMAAGEVNSEFWIKMSLSIFVSGLIIILLFPIIGRWFFKRFDDSISQYIFVLVLLFLGGALLELAGIEPIIGAFLAGLALSRLIHRTSPLMNRINFVGNAIFIPFFLIGVGMLIDYRAFFKDWQTLKVGFIMILIATLAKYLAAWVTQITYKFSVDERRLIFGLSNSQAAATLAAVLVGYNIIVGETTDGEPIRLLNDSVLNGTILMILFTCTLASFVTQKGAKNIALAETSEIPAEDSENPEKILIPLSNIETTEELINLGVTVKSRKKKDGLYALNIINNNKIDGSSDKRARNLLNRASVTASATDNYIHELLRYDLNVINGITSVVMEHKITDLILGLHKKKGITDSFLGNLIEGILTKCNTTTLIYKPVQPFSTIKRHIIIAHEKAEKEIGFPFWLIKIWNIARNSSAKLVFYAAPETLKFIRQINSKHPVECELKEFRDWNDFLILARDFQRDDNLIIVLSRKEGLSYHERMNSIPAYLNKYFRNNSFILIYPMQAGISNASKFDWKNTVWEPIEKLDEIGMTIAKLFKGKSNKT